MPIKKGSGVYSTALFMSVTFYLFALFLSLDMLKKTIFRCLQSPGLKDPLNGAALGPLLAGRIRTQQRAGYVYLIVCGSNFCLFAAVNMSSAISNPA